MPSKSAILPYLSPALPRIFAHRGFAAAKGLVENTIPAFEAAVRLGATHIESDIQVTKDGVPVLFHDSDLFRVAGLPRKVHELSLEELHEIELAPGVRIPSLEEALKLLPEARFNLDLKVWAAVSPSVEIIRENGAEDRVLLTSFSDRRRARAVRLLGTPVAGSAGSSRVIALWLAAALRLRPAIGWLAKPVQALQIPTSIGRIRFDSPRFMRQMKRAGLEIHFWTINDADEMNRLISIGADGIVTDRTDIAVNKLRKGA